MPKKKATQGEKIEEPTAQEDEPITTDRNYYSIDAGSLLRLFVDSLEPLDIQEITRQHATKTSKKMTDTLGDDELLSPAQIKKIAKEQEKILSNYVRAYVVRRLSDNNRDQVQKLFKELMKWFSDNIGLDPTALAKRLTKDFPDTDLKKMGRSAPPDLSTSNTSKVGTAKRSK